MSQRNREDYSKKRAIRDISAYEDAITVEVEKTVQKIRERAKILHNELDRYVSKLLHGLKQKYEQEVERIHRALDKLKGTNNTGTRMSRLSAMDKTPRYQSTPRSIDFGLNTSHVSGTSDILSEIGDETHFDKKEIKFFEGETSDRAFGELVGHYTLENSSPISLTATQRMLHATRRSEVKLVRTFKCGDQTETVHAIAPVEEDRAWVCCGWGSRSLQLYDRHGHKLKSATLDIQINDAATYNDGREDVILVTSYKEKSIKRFNPDSLRTSDFAYMSLFPGGLCTDRRSGIYVCFRDSYQRSVTFGSRRMVAKLSKNGEIVATMEKDEEQRNIFGYPFRIAVNVNGDVCVSDYGEGTRGVSVLAKDGTIKFLYRGPSKGSDQPFLPHGITCDADGHILVSDWNNDVVQVLDREGNFLLNLITLKDGVEGPNALGIDKRGYLWVGDSHGVIRIFKYSIFDE